MPRRRLGETWYRSYSFSISTLDGGECSASRSGLRFSPGERTPCTHCTGRWEGHRAGLVKEVRGKFFRLCRRSNIDRLVFQHLARHCTDWATRLTKMWGILLEPAWQWGGYNSVENKTVRGTGQYTGVYMPSIRMGLCGWWPLNFQFHVRLLWTTRNVLKEMAKAIEGRPVIQAVHQNAHLCQ
jgi:hypothetical protein